MNEKTFFLIIFHFFLSFYCYSCYNSSSSSFSPSSSFSSSSSSSSSFKSKYSYCKYYNKLLLPQTISLPLLNKNSGIGQIFNHLEEQNIQLTSTYFNNTPSHNDNHNNNTRHSLNCYKWKCKSSDFKGKNCSYCLPSVFVAGFSKCGTTALCSKLILHPDIKQYRKKEINIFTKYFDTFSWNKFEKRVLDTNPEKTGKYYLDCTASAFRDFNALVYLMKYSPLTKFIFVVRDPYQRLASWLLMFKRALIPERYERFYRVWMSALRKSQYYPKNRYDISVINRLMSKERYVSSFLYAEVLLHWITGVSHNNILVIDHYDLEEHPLEVMRKIEHYLSIPSYSYNINELLSLSVNTGKLPQDDDDHFKSGEINEEKSNNNQKDDEDDEDDENNKIKIKQKINRKKNIHNSNNDKHKKIRKRILIEENISRSKPIHPPYRITDEKLLKLSRKLFQPSLCLFERIFGWPIHISTESEL